jgi:general secretion pathway protein L
MSILYVELPKLRAPAEGADAPSSASWGYALFNETGVLVRQDSTRVELLPKASRVVAVLPPDWLAWHAVQLPHAKLNAARERAALEGALEDRVLDDVASLHMVLGPQVAAPGGAASDAPRRWVAVARLDALQAALAALAQAGHACAQIVPMLEPAAAGAPSRFVALDSADADSPNASVWRVDAAGVVPVAVSALGLLLPDPDAAWLATAKHAAEVEAAVQSHLHADAKVQIVQKHELLQAAASHLNLAQGALRAAVRNGVSGDLGAGLRALVFAPQWRALRWGFCALLGVQLLGLNAYAFSERRALAAKRGAIEQTLRDAFPSTSVILDAPVQMERAVKTLKQTQGALAPSDLEPLLGGLGQEIQSKGALAGVPPRFDAIEFEANTLTLKGKLNDASGQELQRRLSARGLSVQPAADGASLAITTR